MYYQVEIGPATSASTIWLSEHYAPGFNPQSVICVNASGATVFTAASATAVLLGPVSVPAGQTISCAMAGFFTVASTTSTDASNCVVLTTTQASASCPPNAQPGAAKVTATVKTTATLPTDISIAKSASPNAINAPGQVTYTITISNKPANQGGKPVYLGPFLQLYDKLTLFNAASQQFKATMLTTPAPSCSVTPATAPCLQAVPVISNSPLIVSTNAQYFPQAQWGLLAKWTYAANDPGFFPAGAVMTLQYTVKVETIATCASTNQGHGMRNVAFFDLLGEPAATLADASTPDNSTTLTPSPPGDPADVAVTTNLPVCPTLPSGSFLKTQISPSSPVAWGTPVVYKITLTNTSSTTLSNISIKDDVRDVSTPPFKATVVSATCNITNGPPCTGTISPPATFNLSSLASDMWTSTGSPSLPPGATMTLDITIQYDMLGCANAPGTYWPIENRAFAYYSAMINGVLTTLPGQASVVTTTMTQPPLCNFKVDKQFVGGTPATVLFDDLSSPHVYSYNVTFKNNDPVNSMTMFTVADSLRITVAGYASSLPFEYRYSCSGAGVSGYAPAQSTGYPSFATGGGLIYTSQPTQGLPIFQVGGPGATFAPNAMLICTIDVKIKRPAIGDPNCMGTGAAGLENIAFVSSPSGYNVNAGPPANSDLWHAVQAPLPRCFNLQINKTVQPATATSAGPSLAYTVKVLNNGDPIQGMTSPNWLRVTDTFAGTYAPGTANVDAANPTVVSACNPAVNCVWLSNAGNPLSFGIQNLGTGQELDMTFMLTPPFNTASVNNDAKIEMLGPQAVNWYARDPNSLTTLLSVPITTPPQDGAICVHKYEDANGNGSHDPGEAWLSGWTFTIRDQAGNVVAAGVTNVDGIFCTKTSLPPGTYTVTETPQVGWVNTVPGGTKLQITVTVTANQTSDVVFGNCNGCGTGGSVLKICKVAGTGVTVGTPFTFTYSSAAGSGTFPQVPAGPSPGGICVIGPSLPAGTNVTVTETGPPGYSVSSIVGVPALTGTGNPNLATGTAHITLVNGINELTYTNISNNGYLEICKVAGTGIAQGALFTFTVGSNQYTVPAGPAPYGYCSAPIQVSAGQVVITETTGGGAITGCTTMPAAAPCTTTATTATVTIVPGGVSTQTIAIITDGSGPCLICGLNHNQISTPARPRTADTPTTNGANSRGARADANPAER